MSYEFGSRGRPSHQSSPGWSVSAALVFAAALGNITVPNEAIAANLVVGSAQRIVLPDAASLEKFGSSVAIDGDTAAVGAPNDDTPTAVNAGAVYIFLRNGQSQWEQRQRLTASNAAPNNQFGEAVALSGRNLIVGVPDRDSAAGTVYAFRRSTEDTTGTWSQEAQLTPVGLAPADTFGSAIALSGSTALVAATGDTDSAGAVYVFVRSGGNPPWAQQGPRLVAPQRVSDAAFGFSVAVDGDLALVGAPGQTDAGSAFAFRRTGATWSAGQSLAVGAPLASPQPGDAFGSAVSLSGTWSVVGAPKSEVAGVLEAGSAFFFEHVAGSWVARQRFDSPEPFDTGTFGTAVSISGNRAGAGASLDNASLGRVHLFRRENSTWLLHPAPLGPSSTEPETFFGSTVAISSSAVIVGAPDTPCPGSSECGAAYAFPIADAPASVPLLGGFAGAVLAGLSLAGTAFAARRRGKRACH